MNFWKIQACTVSFPGSKGDVTPVDKEKGGSQRVVKHNFE